MSALTALLRLARISNLPTVWSNVLAASVMAGGMSASAIAIAMLAMSLLYTGGMVLNDAFDQRFDRTERPDRPLPSGMLSSELAWATGLGLLFSGALLLSSFGTSARIAAFALLAAIVLYDAWHKGNPVAPFVMGLCRALVYVATVACAAAPLTLPVAGAATALLAYVAGLTFVARQESFDRVGSWWPLVMLMAPVPWALLWLGVDWLSVAMSGLLISLIMTAVSWLVRRKTGDVKRAVSLLIAAIAVIDGLYAASAGNSAIAAVCCALFALTLCLQRLVPGT